MKISVNQWVRMSMCVCLWIIMDHTRIQSRYCSLMNMNQVSFIRFLFAIYSCTCIFLHLFLSSSACIGSTSWIYYKWYQSSPPPKLWFSWLMSSQIFTYHPSNGEQGKGSIPFECYNQPRFAHLLIVSLQR